MCECRRAMFEALDEGSIDKLQLVISAYSVDDVFHTLLQCNDNDETPLEFAIKDILTRESCVDEFGVLSTKFASSPS